MLPLAVAIFSLATAAVTSLRNFVEIEQIKVGMTF